jgi:hypothetical protein
MKKADVENRWSLQELADYFGVDIRTAERIPIPRIEVRTVGRTKPILRFDPEEVRAYEARVRTRPKTKAS